LGLFELELEELFEFDELGLFGFEELFEFEELLLLLFEELFEEFEFLESEELLELFLLTNLEPKPVLTAVAITLVPATTCTALITPSTTFLLEANTKSNILRKTTDTENKINNL
jgi:hypothetical protein